jgi:hypothetical protein
LKEYLSFRISTEHRAFLERIAESRGSGISDAARSVFDDAMASERLNLFAKSGFYQHRKER